MLFGTRTCPPSLSSGVLPLTLLNLGCTRHSSSQLGSALICTRFQAAVACRGLSWHTSFVGVPGYSWYCLPGSGVLCEAACPLAYCPPGSSIECGSILAHLLRRCTRLLKVLPSRQRSAMCSLLSCEDRCPNHQNPNSLLCLEDTTEATPSDNDIRYDIRRPEGMTWME